MINDLDINNIRDFNDAIDYLHKLLNLVETLSQENLELKRQNQELRDEINRLKGEQGKPTIKPKKKQPQQYSSEKDRKQPKDRKRRKKKDHIKTHELRVCYIAFTKKKTRYTKLELIAHPGITWMTHQLG